MADVDEKAATEPAAEEGLTGKQRAFIDAYFVCGFNATEAARRAGYAGDDNVLGVTGSDNLRNPKIKAVIEARFKTMGMGAEEVIARIVDLAGVDPDDFFTTRGRGVNLDLAKAKRLGKLHLIKKYSKGPKGTMVEWPDRLAALTLLADILGLTKKKIELTGKDGGPIQTADATLSDSERAERITALLERARARRDGSVAE